VQVVEVVLGVVDLVRVVLVDRLLSVREFLDLDLV
jgi:hypothetical protein